MLVTGGPTRHASEWRGLSALRGPIRAEVDVVAVHDGARPLAGTALFDAVVRTAREHGGALPARPQPGLVSGDGRWHVTGLVGVQTAGLPCRSLLDAYTRAEADGLPAPTTRLRRDVHRSPGARRPRPRHEPQGHLRRGLALAERLLHSSRPG